MNKLQTQEKYWDNVAEEKEFTTPFQMELFKKFVLKDAQILDVVADYEKYAPKYGNYGTFELQEDLGVALRHYTKKRIDELMSIFKTITFKPVIYTTMNGNKSNGLYYIGKK